MLRSAEIARAAVVVVAFALCAMGASAYRRYPHPRRACSGMEDYPNGGRAVSIRTPEESRHRFLYRPWHNTGLGHAMEVYNLVLRLALHNNLTFVHTPLSLGHGPFVVEPELYFQFGRHPEEVLPGARAALYPRTASSAASAASAVASASASALKVISFPPPELEYKSHRSEAEPKFRAFAAAHGDSHLWFEVPTAMAMADQDSDWSETGSWFRAKYEAARDDRAFAKANGGLNRRVRVTDFERAAVNVAVHVRRGDALMMGSGPADDAFYIATINAVMRAIRAQLAGAGDSGVPLHVHVYTDANKDHKVGGSTALRYIDEKGRDAEIVSKIDCVGCVFVHLGGDAIQTFHHLVYADVLIQSISMFSNTAAIVSRNIKVFSHWNRSLRSLPNTVAAHAQGGGFFDAAAERKFRDLWSAYADCNAQRWRNATPDERARAIAKAPAAAAAPLKPAPATPPIAPFASSKRALTAEEEEELYRRAHDDF